MISFLLIFVTVLSLAGCAAAVPAGKKTKDVFSQTAAVSEKTQEKTASSASEAETSYETGATSETESAPPTSPTPPTTPTEPPTSTTPTEPTEPTTESESGETPPEGHRFNTHVYSCFLDACYDDEYREAFFSLCDALQEGADVFSCASREIYDFCMDEVTHNQLYPVACLQITGKSADGSEPYENGVGRIYYTKSKEDFLARQAWFQSEICEIMNNCIRPDFSEFEKCLALYDYVVSNYAYDYDGTLDSSQDGSYCACLKYKKGICADFAALYAYLLLQSGVDAITVSNFGVDGSPGYHSWTFVDIDGKGYHVDPTWGLKSDLSSKRFTLDYFMMTDRDRAAYGYPAALTEIYLIPYFYAKDCTEYRFAADDRTYRLPDFTYCTGFDPDENVLYYRNRTIDNKEHTFRYE